MIEDFKVFITHQHLFSPQDRMLLAVSGGIDSVVMTDLFARSGYTFGIIHCNFRLRGKASDEDEDFVRRVAAKYKVPCFVKRFDTVEEREQTGESIQMTARRLRYQWFADILRAESYQWVATAHHKNDVLETILFHICKGTGLAGLQGIPVKNDTIVRPLLFADKTAIENYARQHGLTWREDHSNASTKYARNLLRLKVIPHLLQINPNLFQTLDDTLERLKGAGHIVQQYVQDVKDSSMEEKGKDIFLTLSVLRSVEPLPLVLAELLKSYGVAYTQAKTMAHLIREKQGDTTGKRFYTESHTLNIDREHLIISPGKKEDYAEYNLEESTLLLEVPPLFTLTCQFQNTDNFKINTDSRVACLDADKLIFPLQVRPWRTGDWFYPLGMQGKKKLSDFMIDHKIPLNLKQRIYVLTSGKAIVWVIGFRIDDRFKVTQTTRQIFSITQQLL